MALSERRLSVPDGKGEKGISGQGDGVLKVLGGSESTFHHRKAPRISTTGNHLPAAPQLPISAGHVSFLSPF